MNKRKLAETYMINLNLICNKKNSSHGNLHINACIIQCNICCHLQLFNTVYIANTTLYHIYCKNVQLNRTKSGDFYLKNNIPL